MGGWMGEGGDFQRTGWMVGSEKRDIQWVNDPEIFQILSTIFNTIKSFELSRNILDYKACCRSEIHCLLYVIDDH